MDEGIPGAKEARTVDAGRGISWWGEAWTLFAKNAGMWVIMGIIMLVIFGLLTLVPFLGTLAASLIAPVFAGSWLMAARKLEAGGTLEVGDMFAAFQGDKLTPLLILGALLLAATLVIGLVIGALGFGTMMGMMMGGAHRSAGGVAATVGVGMFSLLVMLLIGAVVAMAMWYAPALVVFRGVAPVDAVKASFSASLKNMGAFLLYGLLYIVAAIIASIPFGLGWIVLVPLLLLTSYVSYKDVFEAAPAS